MSQCNPSEHPSYRRGSTPADPNGHQSLRSNGIIPRPGYGYLPEETGAVQFGQNGCWRWTGNSGRSGCRVPCFSNSFFASHGGSPIFQFHAVIPTAFPFSFPASRCCARLHQPYIAVLCSMSSLPAHPWISSHRVQLQLCIPNTVLRAPNGTPHRPRRPGMGGPVPPRCHCHSDRWWYVVLSGVSSRAERQSLVTQTRTTGRAPGFAISANWLMANFSTENPDVPTTYRRIPDFPSPGGCAP